MANTTAARLHATLERIVDESVVLTHGIAVRRFEREAGGLFFPVAADFYFDTLTPPQQAAQMKVKRRYETFFDVVRVLLRAAPETLLSQWKDADETFRARWIELETNHALTPDRTRNEATLRKDAAGLKQVLSVLGVGDTGVVFVPDTNSLIDQPDPTLYRTIAGRNDFRFVLLPPVLGELDDLKIAHKNLDVRQGAKRAVTRIKGWRDQARRAGNTLNDGTVVGTGAGSRSSLAGSGSTRSSGRSISGGHGRGESHAGTSAGPRRPLPTASAPERPRPEMRRATPLRAALQQDRFGSYRTLRCPVGQTMSGDRPTITHIGWLSSGPVTETVKARRK